MKEGNPLPLIRLYSYLFYIYLFGLSGWWRKFARLPGDLINVPLYVTEIVLVGGIALLIYMAFYSLDWKKIFFTPRFNESAFFPLIFILILLLPLRIVPDFLKYGFQALRDGVILLYLSFIPMLFWLRHHISLKLVLWSIFLGQTAGILSYYIFNYLGGLDIVYFLPVANDSISIIAIAAVFILFKRWLTLGPAMLCLVPTMLSLLFWMKRSLLLGSFIVIGLIIFYRIDLIKNLSRLAAALILSLIFSTGLLFLPEISKPLVQDMSALIDKFQAAELSDDFKIDASGKDIPEVNQLRNEKREEPHITAAQSSQQETGGDFSKSSQADVFELLGAGLTGPRLMHGEDTAGKGLMSWRLYLWKNALKDIVEHPLWGSGFGPVIVKTLPDGRVTNRETFISGPHNAYLTVIFRLGWPMFFIFIAVPVCFFLRGYKVRMWLNDLQLVALTVIAYSYFNAFLNIGFEAPQASVPAYILMGLLAGEFWNSDRKGCSQNPSGLVVRHTL